MVHFLKWKFWGVTGPAPTTSMPTAPNEASLAPGTPGTSATTGRGEPGVTTARSPTLAVDDAIKARHGGIARHATDRQATWTDEARLLSP
jgi:hypothetical protein